MAPFRQSTDYACDKPHGRLRRCSLCLWLFGIGSFLITGVVALILISAAMAPLESLGWWAGWFGEKKAPSLAPELVATDTDGDVP